jgi:hypothetical protein
LPNDECIPNAAQWRRQSASRKKTSAGASPPLICFNAGADLDAISVLGDEEKQKKIDLLI